MDKGEALQGVSDALRRRDEAERALREAVRAARDAGATWAAIGEALNVTKQWAHERFRDVDDMSPPPARGTPGASPTPAPYSRRLGLPVRRGRAS